MIKKLEEKKDIIILGALGLGVLYIFKIIPEETTLLNLGTNLKYVYLAIIGFAAHLFKKFYASNQKVIFNRTTNSRNLSDPKHLKDLESQRFPNGNPGKNINIPGSNQSLDTVTPSKEFWEDFQKQ